MISLRGYHTRVSHVCDFIASSSRSRVLCNFAFEKKNEFTRKEEGGGGKKKKQGIADVNGMALHRSLHYSLTDLTRWLSSFVSRRKFHD